ncbi:Venom carboxylesterase-6 [Eumeta japonica]|uniref:Venom carboxylesterase-6 n=1 Tax=Eumeta variegata TaxID=151549 RepID=A0A4C1YFD9_EUMVA|nr:Venom carboxylesterase-6 [Eumeta japonica]
MATNPGTVCAQPSSSGMRGVEDCLVLDIHTNSTNSSEASSPVMVWLHGGHYSTGSNQGISFKNLVAEGIVVVALNYRLSIFGFLCLGVADAPGNAGLKDVVAGLRWIKDNIKAFGGNPNNIVLFGHGSGAAMVDLITLQTHTRGLVHKAIAQSGSSLAPWAIAYEPVERAQLFGEKLNYSRKSNEELARTFVNTNLTALLTNLNGFKFTDNTPLFAPCLENPLLDSNDTFMTEAPIDVLRSGNYSKIPFITGYTTAEGSLRASEVIENDWLNKMQANFSQFLQPDLEFVNGSIRNETEASIRDRYFQNRIINMETITDYLEYHGDSMILISVIRGARERATNSPDQVRLYEFGYMGSYGQPWTLDTITLHGARHGRELDYLFGTTAQPRSLITDDTVSTSLVRRWTMFAHTGVPIALTAPGNASWPPFSATAMNCFVYSQPGTANGATENLKQDPHQSRMTYWCVGPHTAYIYGGGLSSIVDVQWVKRTIGFHET